MLDARIDRLETALARLAEAQAKTEERLAALAARVDQLAAAVDQLAARFDQLTARVDQLAAGLDRLTARVDQLTNSMDQLAATVARLVDAVGDMRGDVLEARYHRHASGYFHHILRRIHVVTDEELAQLADEAFRRGALTRAEYQDVLLADLVARGLVWDTGAEAYLIVEVSSVVDSADVRRAVARAGLLGRATGLPVIAAVAGRVITPEAQAQADQAGAWRVLDGRISSPAGQQPLP